MYADDPEAPVGHAFVDVAVVRIQTWLGRTAQLALRRGASTALAVATSRDAVKTALAETPGSTLPPGVVWNDQAGEISGVASLCWPCDRGDLNRATASEVAAVVAQHIRSHLPGVAVQATYGWGASYLEAYAGDMATRLGVEGFLLDLPSLDTNQPLAKGCDTCRAVAASAALVTTSDGRRQLCGDCRQRVAVAGRPTGRHTDLPASQSTMLALVEEAIGAAPAYPTDFEELAKLGPARPGQGATQLATVFADGNRVGELMQRLARDVRLRHQSAKVDAALLLDFCTKSAVAAAAAETLMVSTEATLKVAAVLHLAGGDDVLVTVPAPFAWAFARALSRSFDLFVRSPVDPHAPPPGAGHPPVAVPDKDIHPPLATRLGGEPTLSQGIVFHHFSDPFADVVEAAEALLKSAKKTTLGKEAAVAFVDFDADGGPLGRGADVPLGGEPNVPTEASRVHTMADLGSRADLLSDLSAIPRSQQSALLDLLRDGPSTQPASLREGEGARAALARRIETMSYLPVLAAVGGAKASSSEVATLLLDAGPGGAAARARLRANLDLARWWPTRHEPKEAAS